MPLCCNEHCDWLKPFALSLAQAFFTVIGSIFLHCHWLRPSALRLAQTFYTVTDWLKSSASATASVFLACNGTEAKVELKPSVSSVSASICASVTVPLLTLERNAPSRLRRQCRSLHVLVPEVIFAAFDRQFLHEEKSG